LFCGYEGYQSGSCISIHNADRAFVHDIYYENLIFENAQEKFVDFKIFDSKYSFDKTRGKIKDIYFKNIKL